MAATALEIIFILKVRETKEERPPLTVCYFIRKTKVFTEGASSRVPLERDHMSTAEAREESEYMAFRTL